MLQGQIASLTETGGAISPDGSATIKFFADGTARGVEFAELRQGQKVGFQRDTDANNREYASHVQPIAP